MWSSKRSRRKVKKMLSARRGWGGDGAPCTPCVLSRLPLGMTHLPATNRYFLYRCILRQTHRERRRASRSACVQRRQGRAAATSPIGEHAAFSWWCSFARHYIAILPVRQMDVWFVSEIGLPALPRRALAHVASASHRVLLHHLAET